MDLVLITAADKLSMPSSVLALKHVHTQAFFLQLRPGSPGRFTAIGRRALFCIKHRGEYTSIESETFPTPHFGETKTLPG